MAQVEQIVTVDAIQGSSGLAIREALSIVGSRIADLSLYDIDAVHDLKSVVVLFFGRSSSERKVEHIGARLEPPSILSSTEVDQLVAAPGSVRMLDRVHGRNFLAILAGMAVFQQHNMDLNKYKIEVMSERKFVYVVFSDKNQPEGIKGSVGELGFEVQIEADSIKVLRSNFVK